MLRHLESRINDLKSSLRGTGVKESTVKLLDIATIETLDYYTDSINRLTGDELNKFHSLNSYVKGGKYIPLPIWTKIVPKDKSMISIVPIDTWYDISSASPLTNPLYNSTYDYGVTHPNYTMYNNPEFKNLISDADNKAYYEGVKNLLRSSNAKIPFLKRDNSYLIPQIRKSLIQRLVSSNEYGIITKVSGKRVYYKRQYNEFQSEEYYTNSFAAICDTEEEVAVLIGISKKLYNDVSNLRDLAHKEFLSYFRKGE